MSVTLTNGLGGPFDWLTYAPVGSPDSEYWDWTYVPGGFSTYTWTFTVPAIPGKYEIRLLLHGGYTRAATSPPARRPGPRRGWGRRGTDAEQPVDGDLERGREREPERAPLVQQRRHRDLPALAAHRL